MQPGPLVSDLNKWNERIEVLKCSSLLTFMFTRSATGKLEAYLIGFFTCKSLHFIVLCLFLLHTLLLRNSAMIIPREWQAASSCLCWLPEQFLQVLSQTEARLRDSAGGAPLWSQTSTDSLLYSKPYHTATGRTWATLTLHRCEKLIIVWLGGRIISRRLAITPKLFTLATDHLETKIDKGLLLNCKQKKA